MKENSDLSNLFTQKAITNDLHEIWEQLWKGMYIIGAEHPTNCKDSINLIAAFSLEPFPFNPEMGTLYLHHIKKVPASHKAKLYMDTCIVGFKKTGFEQFKLDLGNWMIDNFQFFVIDSFGLLDTEDIRPKDEFYGK